MTASVIALSIQAGSGGFAVARHLAEELGYRYYDWEITSEAATRAGVTPSEVAASERVPGFFERMMRRRMTANQMGCTAAGSPAIDAAVKSGIDVGMIGQPQIIVTAERHVRPAVDFHFRPLL